MTFDNCVDPAFFFPRASLESDRVRRPVRALVVRGVKESNVAYSGDGHGALSMWNSPVVFNEPQPKFSLALC